MPHPASAPPRSRAVVAGWIALLASSGACARTHAVLWPNGVLRQEGRGAPGAEEGPWTYYYHDGQLRERGRYDGGRRVGRWTQWWPNGQRANDGERRFDEATRSSPREGPWTFWYESGQKRGEGSFAAGLRTGEWTYWKDDGALDAELCGDYELDVLVQ